MNGGIVMYDGEKRYMLIDPRTKLLLLVTISTMMLGGGSAGLMKYIRPALSIVPFILLLSERKIKTSFKYLVLYAVCFGMEFLAIRYLSGTLSFIFLAVSSIMTKFAPGIMMGAFFISTTSVSEFTAAMERMHVTNKLTIPLSVIFRFFPTVGEEYKAISDAMRMRQIRFGGKKVFAMIEYRIVPLIVSIVKIGDELSAAALTRGLGRPVKRTNICEIGFHVQDIIFILFCLASIVIFVISRLGV